MQTLKGQRSRSRGQHINLRLFFVPSGLNSRKNSRRKLKFDILMSQIVSANGQRWNRVSESRVTGSPGQRFWPGRVGSRISVSDPVFDRVSSCHTRVYRGVVSTD